MPTNRTANPLAAQAPSPAPGPGVLPVSVVPIDGENANVASVQEAMTVPADFAGYLQQVALWRPPRTSATVASGFTAVAHTGAGSGSVTPTALSTTQAQATNNPSNFVLKIITPGTIGTMQMQISTDGGATFGGTVTPTATYAIATNVTVTLAGTFAATDTYSFSCTDVPIGAFVDSSAANRGFLVDHLGFPLGQFCDFREDWVGGTTYGVGSGLSNAGYPTNFSRWLLTTGVSASVSGNAITTSYGNSFLTLATGNTSGSTVSFVLGTGSGGIFSMANTSTLAALIFDMSVTAVGATKLQGLGGWTNNSTDQLLVGYDANVSTTNAVLYTNAVTTVLPFAVTGASSPNMRVRIEYGGSATVLGGYVRVFINGLLVYTGNTNMPTSASMGPNFLASALAATPTATMKLGSLRCVWNRWASPELL